MYRKGASLLTATLNEGKDGDKKMTAVAVTAINTDSAELAELDCVLILRYFLKVQRTRLAALFLYLYFMSEKKAGPDGFYLSTWFGWSRNHACQSFSLQRSPLPPGDLWDTF